MRNATGRHTHTQPATRTTMGTISDPHNKVTRTTLFRHFATTRPHGQEAVRRETRQTDRNFVWVLHTNACAGGHRTPSLRRRQRPPDWGKRYATLLHTQRTPHPRMTSRSTHMPGNQELHASGTISAKYGLAMTRLIAALPLGNRMAKRDTVQCALSVCLRRVGLGPVAACKCLPTRANGGVPMLGWARRTTAHTRTACNMAALGGACCHATP